jgi:hypothetical protein
MQSEPNSTQSDATPYTTSRPRRPKFHRTGRPRVLDDAKRREVCAFIAGGCDLRDAARYVNCSVNTIRREADRNPEFAEQLRDSEAHVRLSPLRAMQRAMATHWRAAAWFLERTYPERFAKRTPGVFGAREARELMKEVLSIMRAEFCDPLKADDVERRIRGTFEYHIRMTCDEGRDSASLRATMKFFDDKNRISGPFAELGIPTPERFYRRTDSPRTSPPTRPSTPNKVVRDPAVEREQKDRRPPKESPRAETTPRAKPTTLRRQATKPTRTPVIPTQAGTQQSEAHSSAIDGTATPQPTSKRPEPVQPQTQPSTKPDRKPDPQTAPPEIERLRDAVKRTNLTPGPLGKFIHDLSKNLEAQTPTSRPVEPTNSKTH